MRLCDGRRETYACSWRAQTTLCRFPTVSMGDLTSSVSSVRRLINSWLYLTLPYVTLPSASASRKSPYLEGAMPSSDPTGGIAIECTTGLLFAFCFSLRCVRSYVSCEVLPVLFICMKSHIGLCTFRF